MDITKLTGYTPGDFTYNRDVINNRWRIITGLDGYGAVASVYREQDAILFMASKDLLTLAIKGLELAERGQRLFMQIVDSETNQPTGKWNCRATDAEREEFMQAVRALREMGGKL